MAFTENVGIGNFILKEFITSTQISAGVPAGSILTLTKGSFSKVRLTGLVSSGEESGISIVVDGVTVISSKTLDGGATSVISSNEFNVGASTAAPQSSYGISVGTLPYIEANSTISIVKSGGATTTNIVYSFARGD